MTLHTSPSTKWKSPPRGKPVDSRDSHATPPQLGRDYEKLIFRFGSRDLRLTNVHGRGITKIPS
jgi:hypothetical protein